MVGLDLSWKEFLVTGPCSILIEDPDLWHYRSTYVPYSMQCMFVMSVRNERFDHLNGDSA